MSLALFIFSDNEKADRAWKRTLAFDNSEISGNNLWRNIINVIVIGTIIIKLLFSAIFMGQLKSTLKCRTCDHISITFDPFWDLSLPIPSSSSSSITDYRTSMLVLF